MVRRRHQQGYALLTALMVVFLLSVALSLLGTSLQLRMSMVRNDGKTVLLGALSDAAVAETLAGLASNADFGGEPEHEFGGGTISSEVQRVSLADYNVVATAKLGDRRRTVFAKVLREPGKPPRVIEWRRLPGSDPGF